MTLLQLSNNIRIGDSDDLVESIFKERFVGEDNYLKNVFHIFAENASVKTHNELMLTQLDEAITSNEVIGQVPERQQLISEEVLSLKSRKLSDSENLLYMLQLKTGARIMLI